MVVLVLVFILVRNHVTETVPSICFKLANTLHAKLLTFEFTFCRRLLQGSISIRKIEVPVYTF